MSHEKGSSSSIRPGMTLSVRGVSLSIRDPCEIMRWGGRPMVVLKNPCTPLLGAVKSVSGSKRTREYLLTEPESCVNFWKESWVIRES
jgi:hypothetical protein